MSNWQQGPSHNGNFQNGDFHNDETYVGAPTPNYGTAHLPQTPYYQPDPGGSPYQPAGPYYRPGTTGGLSGTNTGSGSMIGIIVVGGGALLAVLGLFLDWYSYGPASSGLKLLHNYAGHPGAKGLPTVFFGGLLWVLLIATVVAAAGANLGLAASKVLAVVAAVTGLVSAVLLYTSLSQMGNGTDPFTGAEVHHGVFEHAAIGLFLLFLGLIATGAGGLFGLARR